MLDKMIERLKFFFKPFLDQPRWLQITLGLLTAFLLYAIFSNSVISFLFGGIIKLIPLVFDIFLALLKYFAVLIVLQAIFVKFIENEWYRKIAWLLVIVIFSTLNELGVFGEISWNPLKIKASFAYVEFQMQLLCFYYVIVLLIIPKFLWDILTKLFITILTLTSSGLSLIPVIGTLISVLLSTLVAFSVITFFVLNMV
ncbi:MAG: hypothetical protein EAZ97_13220, partial [Bacteroidetes bacterium]